MKGCLDSVYNNGIEQMGQSEEIADGSPLIYRTLTVVSGQLGGGSSFGLMTLFVSSQNRVYVGSSGAQFDLFCVGTILCLQICLFLGWLMVLLSLPHRERCHRELWLIVVVLVFVFAGLRH